MEGSKLTLLTFYLDNNRFAIPLSQVTKVVRAVAITPVPDLHTVIHGVIDVHGEIIPVINLRQKFSVQNKAVSPDDRFILISTTHRSLALVVDGTGEIIEVDEDKLTNTRLPSADDQRTDDITISPPMTLNRFMRDDACITLIYDLEELLQSGLELVLTDLDRKLATPGVNE